MWKLGALSNNIVTMSLPFTFITGDRTKTQNKAKCSVPPEETWPADSESRDCCQPLHTAVTVQLDQGLPSLLSKGIATLARKLKCYVCHLKFPIVGSNLSILFRDHQKHDLYPVKPTTHPSKATPAIWENPDGNFCLSYL